MKIRSGAGTLVSGGSFALALFQLCSRFVLALFSCRNYIRPFVFNSFLALFWRKTSFIFVFWPPPPRSHRSRSHPRALRPRKVPTAPKLTIRSAHESRLPYKLGRSLYGNIKLSIVNIRTRRILLLTIDFLGDRLAAYQTRVASVWASSGVVAPSGYN